MVRGRNVCLFYILGLCKFSEDKCNYAHDKTYLPHAPNTWDNKQWLQSTREVVKFSGAHRSAKKMELIAAAIKPPITREGSLPHVSLRESMKTTLDLWDTIGMYNQLDEGEIDESEIDESEMYERAMNCGFTQDEVMELMSQGVKPWDENAWVRCCAFWGYYVTDVLNRMF